MADLNINLNGLELKNPVLTASGTFGYGLEFQDFIQLDKLGGFIVKGTTLKHREGNSYPRMAETPSGMLNAVGLQNKGVDYFIERIYPEIKDIETNILVNVSANFCKAASSSTEASGMVAFRRSARHMSSWQLT